MHQDKHSYLRHIIYVLSGTLTLPQLKQRAAELAAQAFRPGTQQNHRIQARVYKQFCNTYGFNWRAPTEDTLVWYITHLVDRFQSAASVRNYFSGAKFVFKDMCLDPPAFHSHHVAWQLRAADLTMRTPPSPKLPISPQLLTQLCQLCPGLGPLGPAMKVALTFGFFGMLRQSNLAPASAQDFDRTRHTCCGDVFLAPPGLVVYVKWAKAQQAVQDTNLLPLPELKGHPADPVAAFRQLTLLSPSRSSMQPLLTHPSPAGRVTVTTAHLSKALQDMLTTLRLPARSYSLHSLRRGGCTAAYKQNVPVVDVKRHGRWTSDAFWGYVAAPQVANSKVASALHRAVTQ